MSWEWETRDGRKVGEEVLESRERILPLEISQLSFSYSLKLLPFQIEKRRGETVIPSTNRRGFVEMLLSLVQSTLLVVSAVGVLVVAEEISSPIRAYFPET